MNILINFGMSAVLAFVLAVWVALPWQVIVALVVLLGLWMLLARKGRQTSVVTSVGLSTLLERSGSSAVIVVGISGVVGVLVALLAMAEGYTETLKAGGSADTAIVMRGASASEAMSVLDHDSIKIISQAPGIARDGKGNPLASPELVVATSVPLKSREANADGSVQFRGVGDQIFSVRPNVKIIAGRSFNPGMRELIVGKGAMRLFDGLTPGHEVRLGSQAWTVVGVFQSGDVLESEIWGDANVVADTYRRGSSRAAVTVRLANSQQFHTFKNALEANPQLKINVSTTADYFAKQSEAVTKIIRAVGIAVGAIMAIGATFGALNTMFASVESRTREIATLRAIGFSGLPVVVGVMLETALLALTGGLVGGMLDWLLFNGHNVSTMAGAIGNLSFPMLVTPALLWTGLKWALALGFIGGLFPAVRAARLPVAKALREL